MTRHRLITTAQLLLTLDALLLGVGLAGPCVTVAPRFGPYTSVVSQLDRTLLSQDTYSVLQGLAQMTADGHFPLAVLVGLFSVLFPLVKLSVMWISLHELAAGVVENEHFLHRAEKLAKYSMVDVFLIAVLVVAAKGLPGGTRITPEWGMYAFALSVLLSLVLPWIIRRIAPLKGECLSRA